MENISNMQTESIIQKHLLSFFGSRTTRTRKLRFRFAKRNYVSFLHSIFVHCSGHDVSKTDSGAAVPESETT
jgi:hypothetical protein